VDEAVGAGVSHNSKWSSGRLVGYVACGRSLLERGVGPVGVVVVDVVGDDAFELTAVPDERSVEELSA
jgi:hypothetical protein